MPPLTYEKMLERYGLARQIDDDRFAPMAVIPGR